MNITVVGVGYVGLVTGVCFSDLGNRVTCVNRDENKIRKLKQGTPTIYEPGLEELLKRNVREGRLSFTTNLANAVKKSRVVFIAVGTPSGRDGKADLSAVRDVAKKIGLAMNGYKVIVNKSTVPVGTGDLVTRMIRKHYSGRFSVVSNPEFLREGSAIQDSLHPDRIIIGNGDQEGRAIMEELYAPFSSPIVFTDLKSAELIKYASNAILATQISFINSVAQICEQVGADVETVARGMKLDKRIGPNAFLNAGGGYGGSCFPKDTKALIKIAETTGVRFGILKEVEVVNEYQKRSIVAKTRKILGNLKGKKIGIWGLAFKPNTDDLREALSLSVVSDLLKARALVKAFDPVAEDGARIVFPRVSFCPNAEEAAKEVDALLILTEWNEFKEVDKHQLKKLLGKPNIVDARNLFDPLEMKSLGFHYVSVGRSV